MIFFWRFEEIFLKKSTAAALRGGIYINIYLEYIILRLLYVFLNIYLNILKKLNLCRICIKIKNLSPIFLRKTLKTLRKHTHFLTQRHSKPYSKALTFYANTLKIYAKALNPYAKARTWRFVKFF